MSGSETSGLPNDFKGLRHWGRLLTGPTARHFVGRLVLAVVSVWVVFTVTFFLMHLAPGGPFAGAERLSAQAQINLHERFGLGEPLGHQYMAMLGGVLQGDLGDSLVFAPGRSVWAVLADAAPVSLLLGASGFVLALLMGVAGGLLAGLGRKRWLGRILGLLSLLCISLSVLVISGLLRRWALVPGSPLRLGVSEGWRGWVLPTVCLGLAYGAIYFRLVRSSVKGVMQGPRGTAVLGRGVAQRRFWWRYVLPEALVPLLSYMGPSLAALLTGSFVVERMFELPGLSACFVQGALSRDYPLVCGAILFYTVLLVALNLLFESLHYLLDPRLRGDSKGGAA